MNARLLLCDSLPWHVDQVGVNAPGRPTMMTFLPAHRLAKSTSPPTPNSRSNL